jgi:hypothetical protein
MPKNRTYPRKGTTKKGAVRKEKYSRKTVSKDIYPKKDISWTGHLRMDKSKERHI